MELLSLPDHLLSRVMVACAADERQAGGRSHVGLACRRLWQLFAAARFGGGRVMALDASSLSQGPSAGVPGPQAGPGADAEWRSMRAAAAAYAPGVTALRLTGFDLQGSATAGRQAELLALLAHRVQRLELRGCAINAPLLRLLASWPALQHVGVQATGLQAQPLLDVAGALAGMPALESVSLHGAATWAAATHEFGGLVRALAALPRLRECSLGPLGGAAVPASLAQLGGTLTRLHLDCSGHAYTAGDTERLHPGYAALWRLRACQELTLEDARAFMWPAEPSAVDLPALRTLRLRRGDMPRDLLPPALLCAAALPALGILSVDFELGWQEAEEEEVGPAVGLAPCFTSLTALTHLELASCGLTEVPAEVLALRLHSLSLRDNPLAHLPPSPPAAPGGAQGAEEPWAWARRLRALDLSDTHADLGSLPPWLAAVLQ